MATNIIMPALELAQESGKVLRWLKSPGETVQKGEPIVEIETDKVTVEIEAPASGVLRDVTAQQGDVVPVGRTIATIVAANEVGVARRRWSCRRPARPPPAPSVAARRRRVGRCIGRRGEGVAARPEARRAARRRSRAAEDGQRAHREGGRPRLRREPEGLVVGSRRGRGATRGGFAEGATPGDRAWSRHRLAPRLGPGRRRPRRGRSHGGPPRGGGFRRPGTRPGEGSASARSGESWPSA